MGRVTAGLGSALCAGAILLAASASAGSAATPSCSLPELTQDKLDAGAHRLALYRQRRRHEFAAGLHGFRPATGKLTEKDATLFARSYFLRVIFGLDKRPKLIRALIEAGRAGSPRVVYLLGIPLTREEKQMISFSVFAVYSAQRLDLYGKSCAPGYAGSFQEGLLLGGSGLRFGVRFKQDRAFHREALKRQFALWPLLDPLGADFSLTELNRTMRRIGSDRDLFRRRGIFILLRGIDVASNTIQVLGIARHPGSATAFMEKRYGDAVEVVLVPGSRIHSRRAEAMRDSILLPRRAQRLQARVARALRADG